MRRQLLALRCWTTMILCAAASLLAGQLQGEEWKPLTGLFHNEDCTHFFGTQQIPPGKAGEVIDAYVDGMAKAGVKVFLCNTNSRRTNYKSRVWDSYWDGYDPTGPDDQPFLTSVPREDVRAYRNLIHNMLAVHQQGIDYPARVVQRCRHNGMSPWISLRMNDYHYDNIADHPFHGSFWRNNPQFRQKNRSRCLDYARQEVRDFYRALIVETLDRYDIDGLELDFMREPFVFNIGEEAQGAPILTDWIRQIRGLANAAAVKRHHPIRLGVRVPSRPETAGAMGLDAITWAKEGLIDLLVVTPRWATVEFDMPIQHWRELLRDSRVTLAGGLETRYQPWRGALASACSPELATGAAVSILSEGADAVYLFNYFQGRWPRAVYQRTLKAMNSLDSLVELPRRVGITYRDIVAPKEGYKPPLPATGNKLVFRINLGPIPRDRRCCELEIAVAASQGKSSTTPLVSVNGKPCELRSDAEKGGLRSLVFSVPAAALMDNRRQEVTICCPEQKELTIQKLEMAIDGQSGAE
jgi:hypothetical protein